jgi:hypothetical protein
MLSESQKHEMLGAIHRHWIWANAIRQKFYEFQMERSPATEGALDWFLSSAGMHMCLWYGLLFVVCQALRQGGFEVPNLQPEIDEIYEGLHDFRNAIFHVQPKYWSDKLFKIMKDPESPTKIRNVHKGIGKWLLTQIGNHPSTNT